jgi:DNA-binding transcriptional LysR family regulator
MSYRLEHPAPDFLPLAGLATVSAHDMARYPLVSIEPTDPYGQIMSQLFEREQISFDLIIKARFGTTVCALVKAGLGVAIMDEFTIAHGSMPGIVAVTIRDDTPIQTFVAVRKDRALSRYAENFIRLLRAEMTIVASGSTAQSPNRIT